ncbi:hypothetical protein BSKO_13009 [Bryopsis sp. KO-2023]|nr:hypothetical protein BSKO_13009 [Bryopsis sp. KO-2023]
MRRTLSATLTPFGKEFCVRTEGGKSLAFYAGLVLFSIFIAQQAVGFGGLLVVLGIAVFVSATSCQSEKLIVWEGLGITLESRSRLGCIDSKFIEIEKIKDVVLSEVMTSVSVDFYLVFVVRGQDELAVAFEHLKPRLSITRQVYRDLCAMGVVS